MLRVVRFGRSPPVLEKRHQYMGPDGWRNGKVRGLTGLDFATAVQHMEEYESVLLAPWRAPRAGIEGDGEPFPPA